VTSLLLFTFLHWRRKWQPTPVFLPGESQGRGSLVGCRLWGRTEWDTTEATEHARLHTSRERAAQVALVVKNPPANAGDIRVADLIPESGRSTGGGHSNPVQYSCLENPMDRGAWWTMVHGVTKRRTQLKQLSMHPLKGPGTQR